MLGPKIAFSNRKHPPIEFQRHCRLIVQFICESDGKRRQGSLLVPGRTRCAEKEVSIVVLVCVKGVEDVEDVEDVVTYYLAARLAWSPEIPVTR
jgi:hypothetical protein